MHQKTTKYCLKIQNSLSETKKEINKYKCSFCNKSFSILCRLEYHLEICKKKTNSKFQERIMVLENENTLLNKEILNLKEEILNLKEENKLLKNKLENQLEEFYNKNIEYRDKLIEKKDDIISNIANKSTTTTTNNTTNNVLNLKEFDLDKSFFINIIKENFNGEHLRKGVKGLVDSVFPVLKENEIDKKLKVTDKTRNIIKYKENGVIHKDGGQKVARLLYIGGSKVVDNAYDQQKDVILEHPDDKQEEEFTEIIKGRKEILQIYNNDTKAVDIIKNKLLENE